jgi:hypothetical protein
MYLGFCLGSLWGSSEFLHRHHRIQLQCIDHQGKILHYWAFHHSIGSFLPLSSYMCHKGKRIKIQSQLPIMFHHRSNLGIGFYCQFERIV